MNYLLILLLDICFYELKIFLAKEVFLFLLSYCLLEFVIGEIIYDKGYMNRKRKFGVYM